MLEQNKFDEYIFKHKIPPEGIDYINYVRASNAPARLVGTHAKKNTSGFYFSNLMKWTISVESNAELRFAIGTDYLHTVVECWDQIEPITISRTIKNGQKRNSAYTPDFLILTDKGPIIIEVKTEDDLKKLTKENPNDWIQEGENYRFIPAETAFTKLGLKFSVVSDRDLPKVKTANIKILLQSRENKHDDYSEIDKKIFKVLDEYYSIPMAELIHIAHINDFSRIIQLIDQQKLFFDIDNELLSNPDNAYISPTKELAELSKRQRSECNKTIVPDLKIESFLVPSTKEAQKILEKLKRIKSSEKSRSVRRWRAQVTIGKKNGLSEFQSLISQDYKKGNREKKLNQKVLDFIIKFINNTYSSSKRLSIYKAYSIYRVEAKEHHPLFNPVSRKTFSKYLISLNQEKIAYGRGGKRAANAATDSTEVFKRSLKAQLAFENVSIDHYLSDIYIVCFSSTENVYIQRPWISAMVDIATNAILAVTMLFSSPSIKSCALLIRECLRRHGRLPQSIIVDRGSDFRSVYFSSLLAHYKIDLIFRPASFPQYGSEVESLFAEFKKEWLSLKVGNITQFKEARSVDGKISPKNTAIHDPYFFFKELQLFCNWRDDTKIIGIHNETTAQKLNTHKNLYPFIGNSVVYDREFMIATAVDSKKYKVDYQRGIHTDGRHYWHPDIQKIRGKKSKLEVRIEPENPNQIYALIENNWVTCQSSSDQTFHTLDPIQRHIQTLLARDTSQLRNFAKTEADENLVRLIREHEEASDTVISSNEINDDNKSLDTSSNDNPSISEESIFDKIRDQNINELESKKWTS